jgi:hypothetical protein
MPDGVTSSLLCDSRRVPAATSLTLAEAAGQSCGDTSMT